METHRRGAEWKSAGEKRRRERRDLVLTSRRRDIGDVPVWSAHADTGRTTRRTSSRTMGQTTGRTGSDTTAAAATYSSAWRSSQSPATISSSPANPRWPGTSQRSINVTIGSRDWLLPN